MSSSTKPHAHAEAALAARDAKDARPDRIATEPTAKPTAHAAPPAPQPHPTDAKGPAASQNESVWQKGDGSDVSEWFAGIPTIRYDPAAPPDCTLVFRHYNAKEKVLGKSMAEWLRFSVCYWHSFVATGNDQFGRATIKRPWDDGTDSLDNHKRRMRAAFEFFTKLGSPFWTFHDRDIAPEGKDWATTDANLKAMTSLAKELQSKTGVKLLWGTANLFTHPRYANGAATNPDAAVFAHAAAQVKRAMDATHELGGQGFVFWMGRDGYQTLLTKCVEKDLLHYAQFLRMAVEYKAKIGFKGQIMIEPKPKEPLAHQYDYDASTVIGFLKRFGLDKDIKLNIEPNHTTLAGHAYEHDVVLSSKLGMLGSIDANTGDPALGWDTDQFPGDLRNCTLLMKAVLEMGGLPNGGLNFDCKVRRESIALDDLFVGHVGAFDMFARALKAAAVLTTNPTLKAIAPNRYASYNSEFGRAIESGKCTFEDCDAYARNNGEPTPQSGGQEKAEMMLNAVVFK